VQRTNELKVTTNEEGTVATLHLNAISPGVHIYSGPVSFTFDEFDLIVDELTNTRTVMLLSQKDKEAR